MVFDDYSWAAHLVDLVLEAGFGRVVGVHLRPLGIDFALGFVVGSAFLDSGLG